MSIADFGGGVAQGLETLLARKRAEELQAAEIARSEALTRQGDRELDLMDALRQAQAGKAAAETDEIRSRLEFLEGLQGRFATPQPTAVVQPTTPQEGTPGPDGTLTFQGGTTVRQGLDPDSQIDRIALRAAGFSPSQILPEPLRSPQELNQREDELFAGKRARGDVPVTRVDTVEGGQPVQRFVQTPALAQQGNVFPSAPTAGERDEDRRIEGVFNIVSDIAELAQKLNTESGPGSLIRRGILTAEAMTRQNIDAADYRGLVEAFGAQLARLAGEVGNLREEDIVRAMQMVPPLGDDEELTRRKLQRLENFLVSKLQSGQLQQTPPDIRISPTGEEDEVLSVTPLP